MSPPWKVLDLLLAMELNVKGRKSQAGRNSLAMDGTPDAPQPSWERRRLRWMNLLHDQEQSLLLLHQCLFSQRDGSRVPQHPTLTQGSDRGDSRQQRGAAAPRRSRRAIEKGHLPFCGHSGSCCDILGDILLCALTDCLLPGSIRQRVCCRRVVQREPGEEAIPMRVTHGGCVPAPEGTTVDPRGEGMQVLGPLALLRGTKARNAPGTGTDPGAAAWLAGA